MRTKAYQFAMAAIVFAMATVGSASAQSCANSITTCGCTISSTGVYSLVADLDYSQGLTSDKACLDVTAANVTLFTNGHYILGPGTGTGIGIHVTSGATNAFLEAAGVQGTTMVYSVLVGWQYGLESQAPGVTADGFGYDVNSVGVLLKGAEQNTISWSEAIENSVYGMWISGGAGNQITGASISDNGIAGVYLGCSATGPHGQVCTNSKNTINTTKTNYLYALTLGSGENYGIAVEQGGSQNTLVDNSSLGNTTDDLFDGNSSCGSDLWQANAFAKSNASCIH